MINVFLELQTKLTFTLYKDFNNKNEARKSNADVVLYTEIFRCRAFSLLLFIPNAVLAQYNQESSAIVFLSKSGLCEVVLIINNHRQSNY